MTDTDLQILHRMLAPCVSFEEGATEGLLCVRFDDGTRLSLGCGPTGRLNMVVVQHGPETPELRSAPPELPEPWFIVEHAVVQSEPCGEAVAVLVARVRHPEGLSAAVYEEEGRVWFDVRGAEDDVVRWLMHRAQVAAASEAPVDALRELRDAEPPTRPRPWSEIRSPRDQGTQRASTDLEAAAALSELRAGESMGTCRSSFCSVGPTPHPRTASCPPPEVPEGSDE